MAIIKTSECCGKKKMREKREKKTRIPYKSHASFIVFSPMLTYGDGFCSVGEIMDREGLSTNAVNVVV
jgi:hypothetical protein